MNRISVTAASVAIFSLAACGTGDPLDDDSPEDRGSDELVIGSQQYHSNTAIAEIYAQVLEHEGYQIDRQYEIGQREVYVPELEAGEIDIFPEYTGNLLEYFASDHEVNEPDSVHAALSEALPEGLEVLDYAEATDQDSYVVTGEFAQEHGLSEVGDLADVDEDLQIASHAEFETRPYGIEGLQEVYGVELTLVPVEDSGGPLTLGALLDGDVEVANIYSADPSIEEHDLVVLEDPEMLVPPQNLVPVVSDRVDEQAQDALEDVGSRIDQDVLLEINDYSQTSQESPAEVAQWWLDQQDMLN